jgi:hypothetical protein
LNVRRVTEENKTYDDTEYTHSRHDSNGAGRIYPPMPQVNGGQRCRNRYRRWWKVGSNERVYRFAMELHGAPLVNVARKTICYWVLLDMTIPCKLYKASVMGFLILYQGTLRNPDDQAQKIYKRLKVLNRYSLLNSEKAEVFEYRKLRRRVSFLVSFLFLCFFS